MTAPTSRTHPLAVLAMLMAIAGWTVLPVIGSVAALRCAQAAARAIAHDPAFDDGDGLLGVAVLLAWAALIAGALAAVALAVWTLASR